MKLPIMGIMTPRLKAKVDRFLKANEGLAAVEFAMIAIPFFFLLFGLLEVCVLFIMSAILEHGVSEAARTIRTGQLQNNGFGEVAFKNAVCAELFSMMACDSKLRLDVKTFADFASTDNPSAIGVDGNLDDTNFEFSPGAANEIVVVRVFYEWDLLTPVLSAPLANMSNNRRLLQATVAFRNEPFGG